MYGFIGQPVIEDFTVVSSTGTSFLDSIPISEFTVQLYNSLDQEFSETVGVTITNLGGGSYRARYTPNSNGQWLLIVIHPIYFPWGKTNSIKVNTFDLDNPALFKTNIAGIKEGNIRRTFVLATVQNNTRNVEIGKLDHFILDVKDDSDIDWSTPLETKTLYMWYAQAGDINPIKVGENG